MFEGLEIRVPAMRGKMGSRTYYAVLMPMSGVPQFFKFTNWAESAQRTANNAS